jgi:hypothetical protein
MSRFRRLAGVAFVLLFVSSWAAATPGQDARPSRKEIGAVSSLPGTFITRIRGWFTGVWSKAGCSLDPSGCKNPTPKEPAQSGVSDSDEIPYTIER